MDEPELTLCAAAMVADTVLIASGILYKIRFGGYGDKYFSYRFPLCNQDNTKRKNL